MNCKKRVAVIGAGIIGLSTAYKILEDVPLCSVTIFSEQFSPHTTGDISAGFIYPYACGGDPNQIRRWFKQTLDRFTALYKRPDAYEIGISPISGYILSNELAVGTEVFPYTRQISDEERNMFLNCRETGYHLTTWTCECSKHLPWLMKQIKELGGVFIQKRIQSLEELRDFDVTVNCSGIQATQLLDDKKMVPDRGQVLVVKAPWIKNFCLIGDDYYILPRLEDVVVGGTHRIGNYSLEVNPEDTERIFEECCKYNPSLRYSERVGVNVGLRPRRESIRLEIEERKVNGETQTVLHNYGHGGSGVTLHWGCAMEASNILKQYIQLKPNL